MEKELKKLIRKWRRYLADVNPDYLSGAQRGTKYAKRECAKELEELLTQQ